MPLQNRVDPWGAIVAHPARGALTGNRGVLHDDQRQLTRRRWTTKAWIACLLRFKDHQRAVMTPRTWTELFFLDEATALAAGHRPCGYCRRADYLRFKAAWRAGNAQPDAALAQIDAQIHMDRVDRKRGKVTYRAALDDLPDGAFIERDAVAYLVWGDRLYRWSFEGYAAPEPRPRDVEVTVLTPRSIVAAIGAGYRPVVAFDR